MGGGGEGGRRGREGGEGGGRERGSDQSNELELQKCWSLTSESYSSPKLTF